MTRYIALLRAVNVGGTGKLPMNELRSLCEKAGFEQVRTYIASGNVVFRSDRSEAQVKRALETAVAGHTGKPVGVIVRTHKEMAAVLEANPFPHEPSSKTVAIFLDGKPPVDAVKAATRQTNEVLVPGRREIYVFYPDGQGRSPLTIPAARTGTGRNMNTVARLSAMAAELDP